MLNDCIHRDKMYILALEVSVGPETWPTGEPGDPKGELNKYRDIVSGPQPDDYWTNQIGTSLDTLTLYVYKAHYRPQTKFPKVMFSQMSVCPQRGVCPIACWDTPPWAQTPQADTPLCRHPLPCPVHAGIHPPVQCMLGYGQQAGGMHPTGMQSCLKLKMA